MGEIAVAEGKHLAITGELAEKFEALVPANGADLDNSEYLSRVKLEYYDAFSKSLSRYEYIKEKGWRRSTKRRYFELNINNKEFNDIAEKSYKETVHTAYRKIRDPAQLIISELKELEDVAEGLIDTYFPGMPQEKNIRKRNQDKEESVVLRSKEDKSVLFGLYHHALDMEEVGKLPSYIHDVEIKTLLKYGYTGGDALSKMELDAQSVTIGGGVRDILLKYKAVMDDYPEVDLSIDPGRFGVLRGLLLTIEKGCYRLANAEISRESTDAATCAIGLRNNIRTFREIMTENLNEKVLKLRKELGGLELSKLEVYNETNDIITNEVVDALREMGYSPRFIRNYGLDGTEDGRKIRCHRPITDTE